MTLLTQDHMFNFMAKEASASPLLKQFGKTGNQLTNSVWEQREFDFQTPPMDFHLIELCLAGSNRAKVDFENETNAKQATSRSGSLMYGAPDQPIAMEGDGHAKFQQIWVDRSVFLDVASNLTNGDPENIKPIGIANLFDPTISQAMATILKEAATPSAAGQLMIDAAAQQIAVTILRRNIERPIEQNRHRALSPDELNRAIDFIEDNIAENEGLDAIAKTIGMSTFYFARAFKEAINMAPHQYLIERRITRAKEMLSGSKEPIAGIAFDCGFSSQSHMTNVFAKRVGISPRKYRQEMQN